jgi:flagellar basal body rod protein FlgB
MDFLSFIPDNISEVLLKIIEFTELRHRVLYRNIHRMTTPGYTPCDLPVIEFAERLNRAITEHIRHHRLLFCDTANIAFGNGGAMRVRPVADARAKVLLETNQDQYLNLQVGRLLENALNQRAARELMKRNCGAACGSHRADLDEVAVNDPSPENSPSQSNAMD